MSASVNLPLYHKVQKFSPGTGSPMWSWKKGRKTVVVVVVWCTDALTYLNCRDSQVVPYAGFVGLFVRCSSRLSISFAFFLHGESTVCASIDVRQHPPLHCLRQSHLRVASQLLQSGGIHGTFASLSSSDSACLSCVRSSFFCHRLSCRLLFGLPPPPQ